MSFKRKRIPHELIIRDSKWEQPYERNRWLLWSIAALLFAGVLSFTIILSMFPEVSDDASIVGEDELDGVFDGDDLALSLTVYFVEHGRQGRGLSHSGRSRDEHVTPANLRNVA